VLHEVEENPKQLWDGATLAVFLTLEAFFLLSQFGIFSGWKKRQAF